MKRDAQRLRPLNASVRLRQSDRRWTAALAHWRDVCPLHAACVTCRRGRLDIACPPLAEWPLLIRFRNLQYLVSARGGL